MKTLLRCFVLACLFSGCIKLTAPTEYTLLICVIDGDTLIIGSNERQVLECTSLDSLLNDDGD